jgi:holo-[acyl-carrier protein] synthase
MVRGIGIDILEIARMKKILERDERFVQRIFTPEEIRYCNSKAAREQHFTARFTAKEAFFKALGMGWRNGMAWKEVCIENNRLGKPEIKISGITRDFFKKNSYREIHLSISHSREYAVSMVIIE